MAHRRAQSPADVIFENEDYDDDFFDDKDNDSRSKPKNGVVPRPSASSRALKVILGVQKTRNHLHELVEEILSLRENIKLAVTNHVLDIDTLSILREKMSLLQKHFRPACIALEVPYTVLVNQTRTEGWYT